METGDLVEVVIGLIALLVGAISWLYRKARGLPTPPSSSSSKPPPPSTPAPPGRTPQRPTRLVVLATLISVLLSSLVASVWISFGAGASPHIQETMGYLTAFYLCVGGPLIAVFAVLFTSALSNLYSEFQGNALPRSLQALIGALLGVILTVPVFLLISGR
jgi:hypothetical protein